MIELKHDQLIFRFPEVHPDAELAINFQRTLRIPDDGRHYPLPAGFGRFPLRHVDDFGVRVPARWNEHGGVMLPMYQSEALWLSFSGRYPFAIKIAAGKINAVTGDSWSTALSQTTQDYVVAPGQPWLDGFCVGKGVIRQFVAMPLGSGFSAEEQVTGAAEHGGLQIIAYPMKREEYERRFRHQRVAEVREAMFSLSMPAEDAFDMGLAPGGQMEQEIEADSFGIECWDTAHKSRCFVHIANSLAWRAITGEQPPTTPLTASEYANAGIPWFDYYSDVPALEGSKVLGGLKGIAQVGAEKGDASLLGNASVPTDTIVQLGKDRPRSRVREGSF